MSSPRRGMGRICKRVFENSPATEGRPIFKHPLTSPGSMADGRADGPAACPPTSPPIATALRSADGHSADVSPRVPAAAGSAAPAVGTSAFSDARRWPGKGPGSDMPHARSTAPPGPPPPPSADDWNVISEMFLSWHTSTIAFLLSASRKRRIFSSGSKGGVASPSGQY